MRSIYLTLLLFFSAFMAHANYATPGTGVRWNLDELVANAGGDVIINGSEYNVNDTIFITLNDTLYITSDAVVKFIVGSYIDVKGVLIIDPPNNVLFTAQNTATGWLGMRLDFSTGSMLNKLTFEYAVSLRLSDCSINISNSIFRFNNNNASTSFGNGAISLFRASPVITNCQFLNNQRAAIQGGSNIANAPKIYGCLFQGNNTTNQNVPQINLGASGPTDTTKIINNQILQASTNSGGIGFLPIGNMNAIITSNTIKDNRYGITISGGNNIYSLINYNRIVNNNTQGNPALGGSGIAFGGGSASSHQNSMVTGNLFQGNLWGITIQNFAQPNLGNLGNADTTDDGKNHFIGNTNATTPGINLYNNSPDPIFAQNNYWGTDDPIQVEASIFHQPDNAALGLVDYSGFQVIPVELSKFTAFQYRRSVILNWETVTEANSDRFEIERSTDANHFEKIATVAAAGNSNTILSYKQADENISFASTILFYRLKLIDLDGSYKYSGILSVRLDKSAKEEFVKVYPTLNNGKQPTMVEIASVEKQNITIRYLNAEGKELSRVTKMLAAGNNKFNLDMPASLPPGNIFINFSGNGIRQTVHIIKN